jgi:hypothetical protein
MGGPGSGRRKGGKSAGLTKLRSKRINASKDGKVKGYHASRKSPSRIVSYLSKGAGK